MYHLTSFLPTASVDLATEVVGYLFQALGLLIFALAVRRCQRAGTAIPFSVAVAADLLCIVMAVLSRSLPAALLWGYGMNTLHGVVAGFYLYQLALVVEWQSRAFVFGLGYGVASIGSWLLSLMSGTNFLRSNYVLIGYAVLAGLTVLLILRERPVEAEEIHYDGDRPTVPLIILAGATVLLLSLVKNLGFSFPMADVGQGINLELSRVCYAVGLVAAGVISDRDRKNGVICCVASLGIPFLMIAISSSVGTSIFFWVLNYLFFGFFTVFRVILFSDISRKAANLLYLSGFGLMFGRLGDAIGTYGCITLADDTIALVIVAAVLFAVTILACFLLYQKIYLPAPIKEKSEQEIFDSFANQYDLSSREQEILRLILEGKSSPEIAEALYVSPNTVKYHIHNLLQKTDCQNRISLVQLYRAT